VELYLTLQYVFMVWCLIMHRENFTITFLSLISHESVQLKCHDKSHKYSAGNCLSAVTMLCHEEIK
jgi:hypothetical protein